MDKNMEIISQLMVTITQTNEWFRICHEDAQIQRATLDLQTVMAVTNTHLRAHETGA